MLVFCYKNKTLDSRRKLAKTADKKAVLLTTKKLYENQVPAWITQYVKGKEPADNARATAMLAEYIGADLSRLANEIDKLAHQPEARAGHRRAPGA